jgi:1,4-dihydroxy-2-naphthoyl-CoA hydrolase
MDKEPQTIWRRPFKLDDLKTFEGNAMPAYVGIVFTEVGPDYIKATMPVDHRTMQPFGILHGGASVVLAETLGSVAGNFCLEDDGYYCVGLDINSNHLRPVSHGVVEATARPFHIGRTTQVWHIEIHNEAGKLVNVSRLTLAVIGHRI